MTWKDRLRNLICAGGALALAGCLVPGATSNGSQSCGNADPDPCTVCLCGRPECTTPVQQECAAKSACVESGGTWSDPDLESANGTADAGAPFCRYIVEDAGILPDAQHD